MSQTDSSEKLSGLGTSYHSLIFAQLRVSSSLVMWFPASPPDYSLQDHGSQPCRTNKRSTEGWISTFPPVSTSTMEMELVQGPEHVP